jgi:hypothetical protein
LPPSLKLRRALEFLAVSKPWRRRDRGIQYAAAYRFKHKRPWNTGSPGQEPGDDTELLFDILHQKQMADLRGLA